MGIPRGRRKTKEKKKGKNRGKKKVEHRKKNGRKRRKTGKRLGREREGGEKERKKFLVAAVDSNSPHLALNSFLYEPYPFLLFFFCLNVFFQLSVLFEFVLCESKKRNEYREVIKYGIILFFLSKSKETQSPRKLSKKKKKIEFKSNYKKPSWPTFRRIDTPDLPV